MKTLTFHDIPTSSRFSVTVPISTSSRKCQSAAGSALSCAAVNLCLLLNQINFINENLLGASWIFIYENLRMSLQSPNRRFVHIGKCARPAFEITQILRQTRAKLPYVCTIIRLRPRAIKFMPFVQLNHVRLFDGDQLHSQ